MSLTRSSLLDRLRDPNNPASWDEFVLQYSKVLNDYARPYCRSEHDHGDIVQNVWLTLCRLMPRFQYQPAKGGFHRLLKRIVRNTAVDWFRRRDGAKAMTDSLNQVADRTNLEPKDEGRQILLDRAKEIIQQRSSPTVWKCFELHVLQRIPAGEVGKSLNVSTNSVYVNASRVTQRIRSMCELMEGAANHA